MDGSVWGGLIYSDRNVSVTGSFEEIDDEDEVTYVYNYNVHLKKGWNLLIGVDKISKDGNTVTISYTANNAPSNLIWAVELNDYNRGGLRSSDAKTSRTHNLFWK